MRQGMGGSTQKKGTQENNKGDAQKAKIQPRHRTWRWTYRTPSWSRSRRGAPSSAGLLQGPRSLLGAQTTPFWPALLCPWSWPLSPPSLGASWELGEVSKVPYAVQISSNLFHPEPKKYINDNRVKEMYYTIKIRVRFTQYFQNCVSSIYMYLYMYLFIYFFMYLFIYFFMYLFIYSFIYLLIYLLIYLFIFIYTSYNVVQ